MKTASRFAPEALEGLRMNEILEAMKSGSADQKLVQIVGAEKDERIEIYIV